MCRPPRGSWIGGGAEGVDGRGTMLVGRGGSVVVSTGGADEVGLSDGAVELAGGVGAPGAPMPFAAWQPATTAAHTMAPANVGSALRTAPA
jgi:hypothetical protein